MFKELAAGVRPALVLTLVFAALLGLGYPALVTAVAQAAFPAAANGSLIRDADGRVIGSARIGQNFTGAGYFHPRPSAAGSGYDPMASGGSNLGPTSRALAERMRADLARLRAENPAVSPADRVPADLVTASASGLDPDLSPEAAFYQVPRVAAARRIDPAALRALVDRSITPPFAGVIGEPHVNVLALNRALDRLAPASASKVR